MESGKNNREVTPSQAATRPRTNAINKSFSIGFLPRLALPPDLNLNVTHTSYQDKG
jgi:hypothetical protein